MARPKKSTAAAAVEPGPALQIIQVEYIRENFHLLDHVYALGKGLNSVPLHVWERVKNHPTVIRMIAAGEIRIIGEE